MKELIYKILVVGLLIGILYALSNLCFYGDKTAIMWAGEYYRMKYRYDEEVRYHTKLYEIQMDMLQCMHKFADLTETQKVLWNVEDYCIKK